MLLCTVMKAELKVSLMNLTYLDCLPITGKCDIAECLALEQACKHISQIVRMVVPAQTELLVHCGC